MAKCAVPFEMEVIQQFFSIGCVHMTLQPSEECILQHRQTFLIFVSFNSPIVKMNLILA